MPSINENKPKDGHDAQESEGGQPVFSISPTLRERAQEWRENRSNQTRARDEDSVLKGFLCRGEPRSPVGLENNRKEGGEHTEGVCAGSPVVESPSECTGGEPV